MGDVNSKKVEVLNGRDSKNEANRGGSSGRSKDLCKIKSRALGIAFGNQSSFEAFNRAISIALHIENPSRTNNFGTNRSINNFPSAISHMCHHLLSASFMPLVSVRSRHSLLQCLWLSLFSEISIFSLIK